MNHINNYLSIIIGKKDNINKGFTLIELLVVVIIVGLLAAIALPNFIGQIGKSRETEGKNNLGTIGRAQHAYHFEQQTFADQVDKLNIIGINNSKYYSFPNPVNINDNIVKHQAIAKTPDIYRTRNYAVGVYHNSGLFDSTLCQGSKVNEAVDAPNTSTGNCSNNGTLLK